MAYIYMKRAWASDTPVPCVMDEIAKNTFKQVDPDIIQTIAYNFQAVVAGTPIYVRCTGKEELAAWVEYLTQKCGVNPEAFINYPRILNEEPE